MIHSETDNYRARRLHAYRHTEALCAIVDALGTHDSPPLPDSGIPAPPSDLVKAELKNQINAMLRLILALNDGHLSPRRLKTW